MTALSARRIWRTSPASWCVLAMLVLVASCNRAAGEVPEVAVASQSSTEAAFAPIRARWASAGPAVRAAMRPMLADLVADLGKKGDSLEPLARAYLAIAWLDAGVPAAADAAARPLYEGSPGATHDLGTLVHGAALRRQGHAKEAIAVLRPLAGKLLDPFARPILYEELTEAAIAEQRWDDALIYAEAWLRALPNEDRLSARAVVAKALGRVPDTVISSVLESARLTPGASGHSDEMLALLHDVLDANSSIPSVAANADAATDGEPAAPEPAIGSLPTFEEGPVHFTPRAIALLVPSSAVGHAADASAVARAAALTLTPSIESAGDAGSMRSSGDAGADAFGVASLPSATHRISVFDTAGTEIGVARALEAAERAGASVVIGGVTQTEADALATAAKTRKVPTILLRAPSFAAPADAYWIAIGPSSADETSATLAAAGPGSRAIVAGWPDAGKEGAPVSDDLDARCDAASKLAGHAAFPVEKWRARRVAMIVVLGDARCASKVAHEISTFAPPALGWKPKLVLAPSALEQAFERSLLARSVVGAGAVPARDDAPAELRRFWSDQDMPVGWMGALGHDALLLAMAATPGDLKSTQELAAMQRARQKTRDRLRTARAALWSTSAAGWADGALARAYRTFDIAAGDAARVSWLPTR